MKEPFSGAVSMSTSSSYSTNESSSTSSPVITYTRENDIMDAISGVASGLANQMLTWANNVFAKTSQITDDAVGNFFNVSQQMQGLSNNLTDQYNNIFSKQNASLAKEADSYNSTARQKLDMGMAGATQAQAGDQALKNSEEQLRSYGIDPSSGRYAALDKAAAVQNAANVAGAENMQRVKDAEMGQRLRSEAVNVGATLPAAIANVNNTAIQANTGASNASLANANTGRNLMSLSNDYLKTAMDIKQPLQGQNSQSKGTGQSNGQSFSPSPAGSSGSGGGGRGSPGGGGSGGGGSGGGGSGAAWMPQHGGPNSYSTGSYNNWGYNDPTVGVGSGDFQWANGNSNDIYQPADGYYMGVGQEGYSDNNIWGGDYGVGSNPFNDSGFGQTYDYGGNNGTYTGGDGAQNTEWGNINYDTGGNNVDPGWGQTYDQPVQTDWGSGASAYGSDYKLGGAIPQKGQNRHAYKGPRPNFMADGGAIDPSMSPSGGQQVDDVQAKGPGNSPINLNADEFVIPQDVARWKGQEFFQKLIMDSRKRFQQAPAHGTPSQG